MSLCIWCTGEVSSHDRELAAVVHDDPDVAWTEHGGGGRNEFLTKGVDGREGCDELFFERVGDGDFAG